MTEQEIRTILRRQREYFATGATLSRKFRAEQLGKLKASLQRHEEELNDALRQDLGSWQAGENCPGICLTGWRDFVNYCPGKKYLPDPRPMLLQYWECASCIMQWECGICRSPYLP